MKLLYTVKEVFSSEEYLKEQKKDYYDIPLYQRGYKWTPKEVKKLLKDIDTFNPSDNKFYCLQNITIVPNGNVFNVVDGQQRLTTLTLLLSYLGHSDLVKDKLKFPNNSIRTETNHFLNNIIINQENGVCETSWEDFIEKNKDYDHQDIFHLFHAYKSINEWFHENNLSIDEFLKKTLNNVRIIINKIDSKNDEEEIFGNLNTKRIPLDGADLFRAILITRVAIEENRKDANIKDIIQLNEKRVKIGWEFDTINNWWNQENVEHYFQRFISIGSEMTSSEFNLFDVSKHPINLLLFLFAESENKKLLTLDLIENYNSSAIVLYKKILKLHNTLVDWFENREIYHFLGFLFANTKISFKMIWDKWEQSENQIDFIKLLKNDIRKVIYKNDIEIDFTDDAIDWYHEDNTTLVQVLILLDVISSLDETQPFMHPLYFTKTSNDIEHIFPQNPKDITEKKDFIEFLNTIEKNDIFNLSGFDNKKDDSKYMEKVELYIQKHISSIKINSIGNLVLLYSSLNRSIGRISYIRKRLRVIDFFYKGYYIQPHTFRVFVRYFNYSEKNTHELEHWTNIDIEANAKAIDNRIKNFFK
ncbi:DUF262 domain-containing protein [uncultured Bacteroides sp.]|uniref:DUF262 domain-containing protein n=1 Tax=uncultured Bacteroides sp. TaxID=162156 RepID=UPI002AABCD48|nr:DUF262 domain-containing protein [uncultured Bacteroides sp.]